MWRSTQKQAHNISADIRMNVRKLEEATNFKYLGEALCKDVTCSAEIRIRIASKVIAIARLNRK